MRALTVTSVSTIEPVSVDELKAHCHIQTTAAGGTTDEDAMLLRILEAARREAENRTRRNLIVKQQTLVLDEFASTIVLPRAAPLSSSATDVAITYVNSTGGTSTVDSTCYTVDTDSEPGKIYEAYDSEWPSDVRGSEGAVRVSYRSGYSSAGTPCPAGIRTWILMRAGFLYENRESAAVGPGGFINLFPRDFVDGLLDEYVLPEVY